MKKLTAAQRRGQKLKDLAAQQKAIEAEEAAYEATIKAAMGKAAGARVRAVEELYDLLDIAPVVTVRRRPDGTEQTLATDRDETKRAAQLVEAVAALVSRQQGHQTT